MKLCIHLCPADLCIICNRLAFETAKRKQENLSTGPMTQQPIKEKSHTQFMVECLMEEVTKSPYKFNERTTEFIKSLATRFFNDPNYQLSEAQYKWLEDLWTK